MRKWQKGVLWGVGGLALVLAIAAFTLHRLTDSAHLKDLARDTVKQTWSRDLTVGGLTLDVFPYPRLHATDVTISNPAWAQDKSLLEAADIKVRLDLFPLLRGNIVLKGVRVSGLKINLEVAKDGQRSWDLPQTQQSSLSQLSLTGLRVDNSIISLRKPDADAKAWQVENLQASADTGLRNIVFSTRVMREKYALQLDGKLDDLSAIGVSNAVTNGAITAKSGQALATIKGKIPLDSTFQHLDIAATIDATSMQEVFGFLSIDRATPAALKASVAIQTSDKKVDVKDLKLQLGKLNLAGEGQWNSAGSKPVINARVQADHIDMVQTLLDIGQPAASSKSDGELFSKGPLAWPLLVALNGIDGKFDATIASLKLRSGIEVTNAAAAMTFNDDKLTINTYSGKLLGGTASGDAVLEGKKKAVHLNLQLNDTSLGSWFKETGKNIAITGGAMKVDAQISTTGASMKELAAALSGPVNIRIGDAKIMSPKAGQAEFWLTGLFSTKSSNRIDLSCMSARLPFQSGVVQGGGIVGARSDASQLLTSGKIDLRTQTLDLRGRVRARSGINLGITTFSDEVRITGAISKPQLNLDASGVVGAIARIGAAIVTGGVSIVATSIWDGANPKSDPCQVVFSPKMKAAEGKGKRK
ncbi:MAG: AsmA family protein [Pseudomonadota bacterium]